MQELLETRGDESAADLIDQIERRSKEIEARRFERARAGRWRIGLLAAAIVTSSGFLAWDLSGRTATPPPFDAEAVRAGLEFTLFVTASGIERHRDQTGDLPATLQEIGLDHPSIAYSVQRGAYRLEATAGAHRVTYADGDDLDALAASYWALQREGTP